MWRNLLRYQKLMCAIYGVLLQNMFFAIYAVLSRNRFVAIYALLRGENLGQNLCPWRKTDKYEVCFSMKMIQKRVFSGYVFTPPPPPPKWAMPKWRACEFGRDFPHPPSTHRPSPYPTCSLAEPCLHSHKLKVLESPVQIIEGKSIQSFRKSSSHVHVVPLVAHVKAGCSCC